jgi:hypothetical protein
MATKKITLNELRTLVKQIITEENHSYNYEEFGKEGERAFNDIMDRYDGPVTEFVVISRAIELATKAGPSKADLYANVLQDALDIIRKYGDLSSLEFR